MNDKERPEDFKPLAPGMPGKRKWDRRAQRIAIVLWPSFGASVFGTMVFFAFIDPELFSAALMPEREISVLTGYGICFFFFWCIAVLSSSTTEFLWHPRKRGRGDKPGGDSSDELNQP